MHIKQLFHPHGLIRATAAAGLMTAAAPGVADDYAIHQYSVTLARGDVADVYVPIIRFNQRRQFTDAFPLITVLQGANVDKAHYETLARSLAQRGFVVAVPNHAQTIPGTAISGLFTDVHVVNDVLTQITAEDDNRYSPLYRVVDTAHIGLIGHSFGGAIGLYASATECNIPFICDETYQRPAALRAAVFYGTHLVNDDQSVTDLDTSTVAVALLQGTLDGVATPTEITSTLSTLELPHALISIEGANHYALCNTNNPTGASPDPIEPVIPQTDAIAAVVNWSEQWFQLRLKGVFRN